MALIRRAPSAGRCATTAGRGAAGNGRRRVAQALQVLGDGALLCGGRGAVVGDHARRLPAPGKHRLGGAGAAGGELRGEPDAPCVMRPPMPAALAAARRRATDWPLRPPNTGASSAGWAGRIAHTVAAAGS